MSPEMMSGKAYSYSSDIWALGCFVHELCQLKHPFEARHFSALQIQIAKGYKCRPPISPIYSANLRGMVRAMLANSPDRRPAAAELLQMKFLAEAKAISRIHSSGENSSSTEGSEPENPQGSVRKVVSRRSKATEKAAAVQPRQILEPPCNPDDGGQNATMVDSYDEPPVCRLEALAEQLEAALTRPVLAQALRILRDLPDDYGADDADITAARVMDTIGIGKCEQHGHLLWEYFALESHIFEGVTIEGA